MNIYSRDDERAIRVQRLVRDWCKSGIIADEQRDRMLGDLPINLRRTNIFLRLTLLVFGLLIIASAAGLTMVIIDPSSGTTTWIALVLGVMCFAAAQSMVTKFRFYRFGVEEALAITAAVFFVWFGALLFGNRFESWYAFGFATAGCYLLYARFGYLYAAIAAIGFAVFFIFGMQQSDTFRRLFSFILLLTIFFFARERRQDHDWEFPADTYAVIEAVAWGALYVVANLKISPWLSQPDEVPQFYWATYGLIWVLPAAGLSFAIRDRHRLMLDVNIVLAIVTLMSNKPYLGGEPKPWDPILFGVLLIAVSLGLRRWLANGPERSRNGFVAHRLLESEKATLAMAGAATVFAPGAPPPSAQEPPPPEFGGGRSGGAGSSATY
jgi:hypothetical protein